MNRQDTIDDATLCKKKVFYDPLLAVGTGDQSKSKLRKLKLPQEVAEYS